MFTAQAEPDKNPEQKKEFWFGRYKELGKTEARQAFLRLLDDLQEESATLAITDRGEKVAVIMGYKQYKTLIAILEHHAQAVGKNPLAGLITKVGDLDKSMAKVNTLFKQSFKKTADSI